MRLVLGISSVDFRRLRRTARQKPSSGFSDLAAAIVAASRVRADDSAVAELVSYEHVSRFARQAWAGDGGHQQTLRRCALLLECDGVSFTEWADVLAVIATTEREHGGAAQLPLVIDTPTFAEAVFA